LKTRWSDPSRNAQRAAIDEELSCDNAVEVECERRRRHPSHNPRSRSAEPCDDEVWKLADQLYLSGRSGAHIVIDGPTIKSGNGILGERRQPTDSIQVSQSDEHQKGICSLLA
jgi:hypothetical protein